METPDTIKYRCVVTGGSCADTTSEATLSVWPLGIRTVSNESISIYPNPTKNTITITSAKTIEKVEILNLMGQKLISQVGKSKTLTIDLEGLVPGVYIIKVNDSYVERVVKE